MGRITVNPGLRDQAWAEINGQRVRITLFEAELLAGLKRGGLQSHDTLMARLEACREVLRWKEPQEPKEVYRDAMNRLARKIRSLGVAIKAEKDVGYRLIMKGNFG